MSSYRTTQLFKGAIRFVLTSGGHIAGIVNPPGPKVRLWTNDTLPGDADEWRAGAVEHRDTWWSDWATWWPIAVGAPRPTDDRRRTRTRRWTTRPVVTSGADAVYRSLRPSAELAWT